MSLDLNNLLFKSSMNTNISYHKVIDHDLRAQLLHLTQFSRLLYETIDCPTDDQVELMDYLQQSARECKQMLDGLAFILKLASKEKVLVELNAAATIEDVFKQKCAAYHVEATLGITDTLPRSVLIDEEHLQALVEALLDNAFKFRSSEKDLELNIEISSDNGALCFVFEDNGRGIPAEFIDNACKLFKKYDDRSKGCGCGLASVAEIARIYGGEVLIASSTDGHQIGTQVRVHFVDYAQGSYKSNSVSGENFASA